MANKYRKPYQQESEVFDLHEEYFNSRAGKNRRANKFERKMADKQKRSRRDREWN